jgi:hypothetical protein
MRNSTRLLVLGLGLFVGACGGSGSGAAPTATPSATGTVLEQAFESCALTLSLPYAELGDGGESLIVDGPSDSSSSLEESIGFSACVLGELETPDYVIFADGLDNFLDGPSRGRVGRDRGFMVISPGQRIRSGPPSLGL